MTVSRVERVPVQQPCVALFFYSKSSPHTCCRLPIWRGWQDREGDFTSAASAASLLLSQIIDLQRILHCDLLLHQTMQASTYV